MPRKLRPGKQRRAAPVDVSPALVDWLLWGDWRAACDRATREGTRHWDLFASWDYQARAWAAVEDTAVRTWADTYPGTRPASWWHWSAPQLRAVRGGFIPIAGLRRCHPSGIPYLEPDWSDPPLVESTPAYLDRLRLWLPGERARVPLAAFAAARFSWDLTVGPVRDAG